MTHGSACDYYRRVLLTDWIKTVPRLAREIMLKNAVRSFLDDAQAVAAVREVLPPALTEGAPSLSEGWKQSSLFDQSVEILRIWSR